MRIPIFTFNCEPLEAVFVERVNRFLGIAIINGKEQRIHIHDPGRVPLLKPKKRVLVCPVDNPNRKTKFDLIAFWHNEWIFSHSGYHSKFFELTIRKTRFLDFKKMRREVKIDNSRIDFLLDDDRLIEVKGCTWIIGDHCFFPDAPTERGRRHIRHLIRASLEGMKTHIFFLVFYSKVKSVGIARSVDPKFYETLLEAFNSNVIFEGLKFSFDGKTLYFIDKIPVDPNITV